MTQTLFVKSKIIVYTDGGSRGNPGPAAFGVIIGNKAYGEYLGSRTNNEAEYEAIIFALKKVKALIGKTKSKESEIEIRSDSELIVKQFNRKYKITEPHLKPLFVDLLNLTLDFKKVSLVHVKRELNKKADAKVNEILDASR